MPGPLPARPARPLTLAARARALRSAPVAALVAVVVLLGLPGGAPAPLRLTGATGSAGEPGAVIDPWPSYDPQTTCQPAAKPGTQQLAAWLQRRFPGSGSSGISRSCRSGGTSEHKEGRAFDWRLDATSARDRGYAAEFITMIRETDAAGNEASLGRRMGIMYVIWNDRMWSGYRGYEPRPYLSSSCRTVKRCSKTLRHRDHLHISLTWRGARALASWYQGTQPEPVASALDTSVTPVTTLEVPAGGSATTALPLLAGRFYKVAAWGATRAADDPRRVADPACSWVDGRGWRTDLPDPLRERYGPTDLLMDGSRVLDENCHGGKHLYTKWVRPTRTAPATFSLPRRVATTGSLTVAITAGAYPIGREVPATPAFVKPPRWVPGSSKPGAPLVAETVELRGSRGAWTAGSLESGADYEVTVSGTAKVSAVVTTDGACGSIDGTGPGWWLRASSDWYHPGADHGHLFVDGRRFGGTGPAGDPDGCATHQHTATLTPDEDGRLWLRLWDPTPGAGDDQGALQVTVRRVSPVQKAPVQKAPEAPVQEAPEPPVQKAPVQEAPEPTPLEPTPVEPSPTELPSVGPTPVTPGPAGPPAVEPTG